MSLPYGESVPVAAEMYGPDVQHRVCTRAVLNLQKEICTPCRVHLCRSEVQAGVGVAWMQGFWTLHGFEELINYWDWFLVGSSWIWGCLLGFYSAWIPGLAEAGILSVCWWPCPSVEVDADCC